MILIGYHFKLVVTECIPYMPKEESDEKFICGCGGRVKAVLLCNGYGKPWRKCGSFDMDACDFAVFSQALYDAGQAGRFEIVFDDQKFYDFLKDNSEIL